jgi:hypothetical protein
MPENINQPGGTRNQPGNQGNPGSTREQDQQNINVNNPQQGSDWNNYRTKELGENEGRVETAEEAAKAFEKEK